AEVLAPGDSGAVEQQRTLVAAPGHRLGTGCGDDDARTVVDLAHHPVVGAGAGEEDRHLGEGPAELLGGAGRAHAAGPQRGAAAGWAGPGPVRTPAPAARGHAGPPGELEGPVALPAPGQLPAAPAGDDGQVPRARDLDEHRAVLQGLLDQPPGRVRDPGG